jgi:hypothetical protein
MTLALAVLALAQNPDFGFPVDSVKAVNDRMIGQLSFAGTSRTRGFLVSSDGAAVFCVDDSKVTVSRPAEGYMSYARFFVRKDDPKSPLYDELQRRVAQGESGKDSDWLEVDGVVLLRADSPKSLTLAYNQDGGHGCGVVTVDLESNNVADNKTLFMGGPKQTIYSAFPDVGSGEVVMDTSPDGDNRDLRSFYALLDGKKLHDTRPGWAPMLLDRKGNHLVSYLYSESGFPQGINLEPVVGDGKDESFGFPAECMMYMFAMLPSRQFIGYFAPRDEEAKDKYAGTYLWDDTAKKWNKACAYELVGASPDGRALLFSDVVYRKSWIVMPKAPTS